MTLGEYISDYLRDAQNRISELSVEMNTIEDQGSYKYEELSKSRMEMALFMDILYQGKWLVRKGVLTIEDITDSTTCIVTVSDIGNLQEGDIIYIKNVAGMTEVNKKKFIARNIYENTFQLYDFDTDTPVNAYPYTAYVSGGSITIGWYNHLALGSDWTEWDVISEIEHIRYYGHINEAPGINFTGHYLKIASTISGGGAGSGSGLPAGQFGQIIWYNNSNEAEAIDYDTWAGQLVTEVISDYFTGRT